ncbi:hypothetical protein [Hymenobacter arizonensis]|uniref:Lipoprotein n=1 Tax=Hymenobacter arizonensis TaxID=1227077 RepID=A0A1I5UUR2_HYMAR|nr:hypothetical protein [Hymenobacter arizonensis]SFP98952.1 hypothetical protein SAMN04515668_1079 [Hymenobacter arizonensis]
MKYLLYLAPVLLCLTACQGGPTAPVSAEVAAPESAKKEQVKAAPANTDKVANPEYIEWDMLTVNGKPHQAITTKQLRSQLGQPDSIAKGAVECGGELETLDGPNGDFWYYGKTMYEVNGTQAVLANFDVTRGKFQGQLGKLKLDQNTTLEDVRRFYPVSAKEADKPSTGRLGEEMSLPFYHKGVQMDASLYLLFRKGRLQKVEFFYPC